jgi:hypothetical protein
MAGVDELLTADEATSVEGAPGPVSVDLSSKVLLHL